MQRGVEVRADAITVVTEPEVVTLSARVLADGARPRRWWSTRTPSARRASRSRWKAPRAGHEATTDDAGTAWGLVAPTERGEARVTIALDGAALRRCGRG